MDKIILVKPTKELPDWNKHLPVPLKGLEKAIVQDTDGQYVKVKYNLKEGGTIGNFNLNHFTTLSGKRISV